MPTTASTVWPTGAGEGNNDARDATRGWHHSHCALTRVVMCNECANVISCSQRVILWIACLPLNRSWVKRSASLLPCSSRSLHSSSRWSRQSVKQSSEKAEAMVQNHDWTDIP